MNADDFARIASGAVDTDGNFLDLLDVPIEETGIDSLDLVVLRTALEKERGSEIPSDVWENAPTFRNLIGQI